ncbi:MAG TPA: hypothetical protein VFL93_06905 [Longimicrobiaceae bacterium]|nr:hypothetical protein [Longimicrobiaceae bacterium]
MQYPFHGPASGCAGSTSSGRAGCACPARTLVHSADRPAQLQLLGPSVDHPLDVAVSFSDLPRLATLLSQAVSRGSVDYQLRGTVAVDAGLLGQPTFGPMPLFGGSIRTR